MYIQFWLFLITVIDKSCGSEVIQQIGSSKVGYFLWVLTRRFSKNYNGSAAVLIVEFRYKQRDR